VQVFAGCPGVLHFPGLSPSYVLPHKVEKALLVKAAIPVGKEI
jgi:hypothetical protein